MEPELSEPPKPPETSQPSETSASTGTTHQGGTSGAPGAPSALTSQGPLILPSLPAAASASDDEERQTLLAALAASRELGPEMDHALADHYLEQRALARSRALRRQQRAPRTFGQRARRFVQRLRENGLLLPLLVGAMALVGVAGVAAITLFAALHGFPLGHHPHPGPAFQHGNAQSAQNGQTDGGPGDGGDGFFPFFGFPWLLPLLLLFIFIRRRRVGQNYQAASGQLRQGQGNGGQPLPPAGYQAPSAVDAPSVSATQAQTPRSTTPTYPTYPTYTGYQPYNPFGVSTGAFSSTGSTHTLPTVEKPNANAGAGSTPGSVTNEVSPPPVTKPLSNPAG